VGGPHCVGPPAKFKSGLNGGAVKHTPGPRKTGGGEYIGKQRGVPKQDFGVGNTQYLEKQNKHWKGKRAPHHTKVKSTNELGATNLD